jgi:hypothetical protein
VLNDIIAQVIAHPVGVPPRAVEQPLHPIRGLLTRLFGQPPAVLALGLAQQPSQVGQRATARLHSPEPLTDALVQLDQPVRPHPGLLLGLLDLAARPRRAPRCLRHVAASLDRKRATYRSQTATVGLSALRPGGGRRIVLTGIGPAAAVPRRGARLAVTVAPVHEVTDGW